MRNAAINVLNYMAGAAGGCVLASLGWVPMGDMSVAWFLTIAAIGIIGASALEVYR